MEVMALASWHSLEDNVQKSIIQVEEGMIMAENWEMSTACLLVWASLHGVFRMQLNCCKMLTSEKIPKPRSERSIKTAATFHSSEYFLLHHRSY